MRHPARPLTLLIALALVPACATTPAAPIQASMTITEEPNTPPPGAAPAQASLHQLLETGAGFTVKMPPNPQTQRNTVKLPAGEVATAAWSTNVDGVLYSVSVADYPKALMRTTKPETFLEEGKTGLVTQLKGTLMEEQAIALGEHAGKAFRVASDSGEAKVRNYLVGNRVYTLLVLYNSAIGAPEADAFLGSLVLTPAATAADQP
ncbi:MAG: hypothetical protein L0Y66_21380 [Myxococcaceae bacterium]|nr:hypothetical protein [Myxococcaceae bacterium]MCI0670638.1 hypothetical protein [Myxococcaceae bacterium]